MHILLLGSVELRLPDGTSPHIGGARRRATLAALALEVNRVVSVDHLVDLIWDQAPPPSARAVLQGHVARLRALFDDTLRLTTRAPGYMLQADPDRIDVHRLRARLKESETAPDREAVRTLFHCLNQWRGPVLDDCDSRTLREQSGHALEETRVRVLEALAQRLLRLGEGHRVRAELADARRARPLNEHLARLLMLCLHQEGRVAEAQSVYHDVRARLADETGLEPGPELREAFARILRPRDPGPASGVPAAVRVAPPRDGHERPGPVAAVAEPGREGIQHARASEPEGGFPGGGFPGGAFLGDGYLDAGERVAAVAGRDAPVLATRALPRRPADPAPRPSPRTTVLHWGLTLIDGVRDQADYGEMQLIDHARALGMTWEQLAGALGYGGHCQAQARWRQLRDRWPGYQPVSEARTAAGRQQAEGSTADAWSFAPPEK
ncbi:BTAD domain-containing putative transcriptional regulator [Streptomyces sp. NPDC047928]|uniref:BTAD domain-containing putative transcriptional regulator n=1 Tax=unclassified Streptomyces TaxID=2593676 RepID=UPI003715E50A